MKNRSGFTLLELIMVIVIIGILAAIAGPMYFKTVERSRIGEARRMLGMIRMAQLRYYAEHATFTPNINELDIDTTDGKFFNLEMTANPGSLQPGDGLPGGASEYLGEVTRNNQQNPYNSNYKLRVLPNGDICHTSTDWPAELGSLIPTCS